jgi:kumamolisin
MSTQSHRVPLKGSERTAVTGSKVVGRAHPHERIEVTVRLRPRAAIRAHTWSEATRASIKDRKYLTREQLAAERGASAEDIAKVEAFARAHQLVAVHSSEARRSVWLAGTVAQMEAAFGVTLNEWAHPQGGTFRGRTGPVHIPADLDGIVMGVFGLDSRPQARANFRRRRTGGNRRRLAADAASTQFTPLQIAALYDFPTQYDGTGECIGIIELGGGYTTADLETYFSQLGLAAPTVTTVSVDGGSNTPTGSPDGPDGEVMLDIEVAGSIGPNARIVVYFTSNTDQGFLDAITQAVNDTVNKPSVISISWGGPESGWTSQSLQEFDQEFQDAAAAGISICTAAGDQGSSDGVNDGQPHVDFPASSPNVLACGGTTLSASGTTILSEVVWNDPDDGATGGGVSDVFPLPAYQQNAGVPPAADSTENIGRGVPDVAADADPDTGYSVRIDGEDTVLGGTSAVAPLWAGLIACLNQALGKPVGFLNPVIYGFTASAGVFRDIVSGNNGAYSAGPGWDACSGLGVADGNKLLEALSQG